MPVVSAVSANREDSMDRLFKAYGIRRSDDRVTIGWSSNEACVVPISEGKHVLGNVHSNSESFGEAKASFLKFGGLLDNEPFVLAANALIFDEHGKLMLSLSKCTLCRNRELKVFNISPLNFLLSSQVRLRVALPSGEKGGFVGYIRGLGFVKMPVFLWKNQSSSIKRQSFRQGPPYARALKRRSKPFEARANGRSKPHA